MNQKPSIIQIRNSVPQVLTLDITEQNKKNVAVECKKPNVAVNKLVKNIRRKTRQTYSAEEYIHIVWRRFAARDVFLHCAVVKDLCSVSLALKKCAADMTTGNLRHYQLGTLPS